MDLWDQQAAEIAAPASTNGAGAAIASQNRSSAPLVACCFKQGAVSGSPANTPRPGLRAEPDDCAMLAAAASLGSFVSSQIERAVDVSVDVVDAASAWVVGAETDASLEDLKGREINGEAELREAARALFRLAESDRRAQSLLAGTDPEAPVDEFALSLLLRSIESEDESAHTWGVRALTFMTDTGSGMRMATHRAVTADLMAWLVPLVRLAQHKREDVERWSNEVLERIGIYGNREMLQQVDRTGFAVLRCLADARHPAAYKAQRAASAALYSLLLNRPESQVDTVRRTGLRALLSLAASSDDMAWTQTALAVAAIQPEASPLQFPEDELRKAVMRGGDGGGCLP